jgi:hypothetical protein
LNSYRGKPPPSRQSPVFQQLHEAGIREEKNEDEDEGAREAA